MSEKRMKISSRREAILSLLQTQGKVSVTELADRLGVTIVTIRKDLDTMDREGLLTRVSGGAVMPIKLSGGDSSRVSNLEQKNASQSRCSP